MRTDISPRGMGKTFRMMQWLSDDPQRVLITFSHDEENRLKRLYPDLANRIVDWESYRCANMRGTWIKEVGIDNADIILQSMIAEPIKRIAISDYEEG